MALDPRALMNGAIQMPSMTAQMEAMKMQQTAMALQFAQNMVMSQYLYQDERDGSEDAKALRAKAKSLIQAYFDGLNITTE